MMTCHSVGLCVYVIAQLKLGQQKSLRSGEYSFLGFGCTSVL